MAASQQMICNPILKGFNPDPSIVRVGKDYYIATSTFEWFPGCQIHHSTDLIHWQLITHPLNRVSQLDMRGVPDSCGVWAPCLTHHNGIFYLVYSNVKSFNGNWKDTPNYVVTAPNITGPWSEPTFVNASGFDASLFHDEDGKSYLLNMVVDHRLGKFFGGIIIQEFCKKALTLVGEHHLIFEGTAHGCTEGPHVYKRNGWYYLVTAEGGTGYDHCVTIARAKSLFGPYELHPDNPIITAKNDSKAYLQKTGHADLVETQHGEWYAVFLTSRPLTENGRCITGRESAIEKVKWQDDDWLYLSCKSKQARQYVQAPNIEETSVKLPSDSPSYITRFNQQSIDINFQSLRVPITEEWVSTNIRQGFLRLFGRDSLSSCFDQSLIARRVQAHHSLASTCVEFTPKNFQQMAGLVCYYNTVHYHYLHIFGGDFGENTDKKYLTVLSCDKHRTFEPNITPIDISGIDKVYLKAEFLGAHLQFYYAISCSDNGHPNEQDWLKIGPILDGSILSDDYVQQSHIGYQPCFTGAFYGMACQDLSGQNMPADFEYFEYREI